MAQFRPLVTPRMCSVFAILSSLVCSAAGICFLALFASSAGTGIVFYQVALRRMMLAMGVYAVGALGTVAFSIAALVRREGASRMPLVSLVLAIWPLLYVGGSMIAEPAPEQHNYPTKGTGWSHGRDSAPGEPRVNNVERK